MSELHDSTDERLERLRQATAFVRARPDFGARVAAAVDREAAPIDWVADLSWAARRLLPVAALAAAAGLVWALHSQRAWDAALTAAAEADAEW